MKCRVCGLEHPGWVMCGMARAAAASNSVEAASNSASNTMESASNAESVASNTVEPASNSFGRKQRWGRDAYNAYMRDYMRRRRGG